MFRRRSRRMSRPQPVIQSFKKVINFAPTSRAATTVLDNAISTGTDSTAAGQTGPTDGAVPTGSIIKYFEIQYCVQNVADVACFMHVAVQLTHSDQSIVDPRVVGGNSQRNQIFFQKIYCVGHKQNTNILIKFKVPKRFQRVRETDQWHFTRVASVAFADTMQVIYKFYR